MLSSFENISFGEIGLNITYAIIILCLSYIVSVILRRSITRIARSSGHIDTTTFAFLANVVQWILLIIALIAVLGLFGVQTTSLVAVLASAGLAIGLALQGTLSNIAAGVMLVIFRPFKIGDYIEVSGEAGTVDEISIFQTEMNTPDNTHVIIPNNLVWSGIIRNYSAHKRRRADFIFSVAYDSDLDKVAKVLKETAAADARSLKRPEPYAQVSALGASSIDFTLRVWVSLDVFYIYRMDMQRAVKKAFDEAGIEIPFPTTTIIRGDMR